MEQFYEYLYEYGLHDCRIDDIICANTKIIFNFNSGVYKLNSFGKELQLTNNCSMIIEIDETDSEKICNHIDIIQIFKKKVYEIDCHDFINRVRLFKFCVDMNYYSYFCNTVLLKGYINNEQYEITVSEVKNIYFKFI